MSRIIIYLKGHKILTFTSDEVEIRRGIDGIALTYKNDGNFTFIPMNSVLFYELVKVEE